MTRSVRPVRLCASVCRGLATARRVASTARSSAPQALRAQWEWPCCLLSSHRKILIITRSICMQCLIMCHNGDLGSGAQHLLSMAYMPGLATILENCRALPSLCPFWKQPRHPPRGECRGKREAQGGAGALGDEHPAREQGRDDPAGLTVARAEEAGNIPGAAEPRGTGRSSGWSLHVAAGC